MKRYCYICGYETSDDIISECPQCLCNDVFVQSKDEEELMKLFDDRKLTDTMLELKKNNLVEFQLKLQQLKITKEQEKQIKQSKQQEGNDNKLHCPTCNSTKVKKISGTAKVAGTAMFGLFSKIARSQFKCENCGYKW